MGFTGEVARISRLDFKFSVARRLKMGVMGSLARTSNLVFTLDMAPLWWCGLDVLEIT